METTLLDLYVLIISSPGVPTWGKPGGGWNSDQILEIKVKEKWVPWSSESQVSSELGMVCPVPKGGHCWGHFVHKNHPVNVQDLNTGHLVVEV